ncbi:hypothetical protein [Streptomyces minutiscleroticus]
MRHTPVRETAEWPAEQVRAGTGATRVPLWAGAAYAFIEYAERHA